MEKRKEGQIVWKCKCDCGNFCYIRSHSLVCGDTKSCGCYRLAQLIERNHKHGDAIRGKEPRLYDTWINMKQRCSDKNHHHYHRYGGRGIKVCREWQTGYVSFRTWALSHGYRDDLTIDRIDNDKNYEPGNCQWISALENSNKARRKNDGKK
jgi:hypothetical protein